MATTQPVRRFDLSRILFFLVTRGTLLGLMFAIGVRAGVQKTAGYFFWADLGQDIMEAVHLTVEEAPTITGIRPQHFLQPRRHQGDGVTVNDPASNQTDLILLAGFFDGGNELRLLRRDGHVVARWPVRYFDLFPDPDFMTGAKVPQTDWNIDTHGALALPDGSVVFNFDYGGTTRLDRCNKVLWTLRRQTHHSVVRAERGGLWIPGRYWVQGDSAFPPFDTPFSEDTVMRVSDDGEVLSEFSLVKLLYDHGFKGLLTATGARFDKGMKWDNEIIHLNKVDELTTDVAAAFPMFEVGDLVLSIRELNMILVVDAAGTIVKWWQVGPWLRQHDPHFTPDGRILLFNNNIFRSANVADDVTPADTPLVSEIMSVDPATRDVKVVYGGTARESMLSVVRGKVSSTPTGGLLVTEPDGGRVRELNAAKRVVWEYINAYDDDEIVQVNQAQLYPANYFSFDTGAWTCDGR